ncbi:chemotaxis protein CheW [Pseudomonas aeruginosa]
MGLLLFKIGGVESFAIDVLAVKEIMRTGKIVSIPGAPPHIPGMMDVRGQIAPIVDVPRLLFGRDLDMSECQMIILDRPEGLFGLKVSSIDQIYKEQVTLQDHDFMIKEYIDGVFLMPDKTLVQMMNLDAVLVGVTHGYGQ